MISRRHLLKTAAAAGCTLSAPALFAANAAAAAPVAGKEYIIVRPPVEYPKRPIIVHDFFAYTA